MQDYKTNWVNFSKVIQKFATEIYVGLKTYLMLNPFEMSVWWSGDTVLAVGLIGSKNLTLKQIAAAFVGL